MNPHTIKETIKLGESEIREIEMIPDCAEAAADIIKKTEEFKAVRDEAMPAKALTDPKVMEQVKLVDLVWAFDASDNDKSSLIGGGWLLGYSIANRSKTSFSSIGFRYDPDHESLDSLRQTVQALKYAYRRENQIIKTAADDFPILALNITEISDPKVREKVAEADMVAVANRQVEGEVYMFATKAARECKEKGDKLKALKLKFMAFSFDPKVDSLEDFAAALEEIKGKNWQM